MCSVSSGLGLNDNRTLRKKKLPSWFQLYCPELTIYNPNSLFEQALIKLIDNFTIDYTSRVFELVSCREFFKCCPEVFIECVFSPGECLYMYKDTYCQATYTHTHIVGTHNSILYHKTSNPKYFSIIEAAFLLPRTHTISNPNFIKIKKAKKKLIF